MLGNLSLSIIARTDRSVTHYERERERSCINIGRDQGRSVVRTSGGERPRSSEDFRKIKVFE